MTESSLSPSSAVEVTTAPYEDLSQTRDAIAWRDGSPVLIGSECADCWSKAFPPRMACEQCGSTNLKDIDIATTGLLYSQTLVHVSSTRETPYSLGYVDLTDGVRVLTQLAPGALEGPLDVQVRLEANADGEWWFGTSNPGEPST